MTLQRRSFLTLLGGAAAAWPLAARAQQPSMPVIGYLSINTSEGNSNALEAFRNGLSEMGYVEGRNLAIEYRFASMQYDRLPELAADLVRRQVTVIATPNGAAAAMAAKAATATIPVVFSTGADPIQAGLVTSFNRPGGNVTGINFMTLDLAGKRIGLLNEMMPGATRLAMLLDPSTPNAQSMISDTRSAAAVIGRQVDVVQARNRTEIDAAFASLVQNRTEAVLVMPQQLFAERRVQVLTLLARHALPAMFPNRPWVAAGGLISYGTNELDQHRQVGIYVGRVLKGEKPADLPVMRPTKFEMVINQQTARTLGITVPPTLLALADEVIE